MTKAIKGIKDPWRIVETIKSKEKKTLDSIDLDPVTTKNFYYLRGNKGSLKIVAKNSYEALQKLVVFFQHLKKEDEDLLYKAGIAYKTGLDYFNTDNITKASTLSCKDIIIYYLETDHDNGLLKLQNLILKLQKSNKKITDQFQIYPILR